jgi:uncharacterized membrane-anchored protein
VTNGLGDPRSWVNRLVGAALGLLIAALAVRLAVDIVRPMLPWIIVIVVSIAAFTAWTAWSRSRW